MVGLDRLELSTSPLSGVRSSHLSYRPFLMGVQSWWSWSGSNRRPPECKSGALPAELQPHYNCCLLRLKHRSRLIQAITLICYAASGSACASRQLSYSPIARFRTEKFLEADWTRDVETSSQRQAKRL